MQPAVSGSNPSGEVTILNFEIGDVDTNLLVSVYLSGVGTFEYMHPLMVCRAQTRPNDRPTNISKVFIRTK